MINHIIALMLSFLPKQFVWLFSKRYISGVDIDDALRVSLKLQEKGSWITIDRLGEFIENLSQADSSRDAYFNVIDRFSSEDINMTYSLKPSSFGLLIDFESCYRLIREVVTKAATANQMVRIDMEDASCVDMEIELFRRLHAEYPHNVGLAIQSYLLRTARDLETIARWHTVVTPVNIRLCKGIYNETEKIAFKKHDEINFRFLKDLEFLFNAGIYVGIATHDRELVSGAKALIERFGLDKNRYEFQMLYGVTPELRDEIIQEGHNLRVYVPFGEEWFGYSTRRLKENPKIVGHVLRALFVRG
jgi:proline dehydrogenase